MDVKEGTYLSVGDNSLLSNDVLVTKVYSEHEGIYKQRSGKIIAEHFVLKGDKWKFKHNGPNGVYTGNSDRLKGKATNRVFFGGFIP